MPAKPLFKISDSPGPEFKYWVEPHISGYGTEVEFFVGKEGNISGIDNPRAAEVDRNNPKKLLFKNSKVRITSQNYSGNIRFGDFRTQITQNKPLEITIVPYTAMYMFVAGEAGSERLFVTTKYERVVPQEIRLQTSSAGTFAWFKLEGVK